MKKPQEDIFINCPYDDGYRAEHLPAIAFALLYLGYNPRTASERTGTRGRLEIIYDLIAHSRLSIHDISPIGEKKRRHNMPFELGLFMGAIQFGAYPGEEELRSRALAEGVSEKFLRERLSRGCFVIVREGVSFETDFSDMNAIDPQQYHGTSSLIERVRTWIRRREMDEGREDCDRSQLKNIGLAGKEFEEFLSHFREKVQPDLGHDLAQLDFENLKLVIETWLATERRVMVE